MASSQLTPRSALVKRSKTTQSPTRARRSPTQSRASTLAANPPVTVCSGASTAASFPLAPCPRCCSALRVMENDRALYRAVLQDAANNTSDCAPADVFTCYLGTLEAYADSGYMDAQLPAAVVANIGWHVESARALAASDARCEPAFRLTPAELLDRVLRSATFAAA